MFSSVFRAYLDAEGCGNNEKHCQRTNQEDSQKGIEDEKIDRPRNVRTGCYLRAAPKAERGSLNTRANTARRAYRGNPSVRYCRFNAHLRTLPNGGLRELLTRASADRLAFSNNPNCLPSESMFRRHNAATGSPDFIISTK